VPQCPIAGDATDCECAETPTFELPVKILTLDLMTRFPKREQQFDDQTTFYVCFFLNFHCSDPVYFICCAPHWDNFHRVELKSTYLSLTYSVFTADTLRHTETLTFDSCDLERL